MNYKILIFIGIHSFSVAFAGSEKTEEATVIRFEHHKFTPQTLPVPANKPLSLKIINLSDERIEFESFSLNREKVIEPGKSVTLNLPALRVGRYDFFDDLHDDVSEGVIIAK